MIRAGELVNARAEAYERIGGRFEVRVLEPSPPGSTTRPGARTILSPGETCRPATRSSRPSARVVQEAGAERRAPITTLDAAADHVGRDSLPDDLELGSDVLGVDPAAAAFLGDWYGFAASVLEELRAGASDDLEPSRVQLWPEHFDLAVELGAEQASARARRAVAGLRLQRSRALICRAAQGPGPAGLRGSSSSVHGSLH